MRSSNFFCAQNRQKIMFGALLVALAASSIATIIIAEGYANVTLLTSPDENSIRTQGGKSFNVSCEGVGGEAGKFTFLKWTTNGGREIRNGDPKTVKIGNKLYLAFINPKIKHGGAYWCSAVYGNGVQLQKKIYLEFYATKPEFLISYENVTLEAGKPQYLTCQAEGDNPIDYKWYNQEEDRITDDPNEPVHALYHGTHSRLNFKSLDKEHEGSYTCTASNTHGLTSKVFNLRLSPKVDGNDTDIDEGDGTTRFRDAKVLTYTANNVTFYISTSGPVKYIEAQYREGTRLKKESISSIIRLDPNPENIYAIENLLPSGYYSFQFRTVPSTSDDWSRKYNVTLFPDVPEIIWQNIGDKNVRLRWHTKTDDVLRGTIDRYQIKYFSVQMEGGNGWTSRNCSVTIEVPTCVGSMYTIAELGRNVFYQIEVRAHTEAGYGEPARQKVFMSE